MVVAVTVTLTEVPLVTVMFPGAILPVPLEKTPLRLADPPAVTDDGLAEKLEMTGAAGVEVPVDELPQPIRPLRTSRGARNRIAQSGVPFMENPDQRKDASRTRSSATGFLSINATASQLNALVVENNC